MLTRLWQRCRSTVLFVTHDLREALALADRVCFLSRTRHNGAGLPIELPRPRSPNDEAVLALHAELLAQYPALLAGLTAALQTSEEVLDA